MIERKKTETENGMVFGLGSGARCEKEGERICDAGDRDGENDDSYEGPG